MLYPCRLEPRLSVEVLALAATIGVGLKAQVGNDEIHVRFCRGSFLKALDGLQPSFKLFVDILDQVRSPGQFSKPVMHHELLPVPPEECYRLPTLLRQCCV